MQYYHPITPLTDFSFGIIFFFNMYYFSYNLIFYYFPTDKYETRTKNVHRSLFESYPWFHDHLCKTLRIPVLSALHSIPSFRIFSIIFSFSLTGGIYNAVSSASGFFFGIICLLLYNFAPLSVKILPRGVFSTYPCIIRYGSNTSVIVSSASPRMHESVCKPTGF